MTYRLDKISIRLKENRNDFKKINQIYDNIFNGKIPLIHDNEHKLDKNLIPIAAYDKELF